MQFFLNVRKVACAVLTDNFFLNRIGTGQIVMSIKKRYIVASF